MKEINPELLRKTASAIRELDRENKELKQENDSFRKTAEATNLAVKMLKDGELDPEDFETKVAEFRDGDLEVIKTAMSMNSTQSSDLGKLNDEVILESDEDPLSSYLMSLAQ